MDNTMGNSMGNPMGNPMDSSMGNPMDNTSQDPIDKVLSPEAQFTDYLRALELTESIDRASPDELREVVKRLTRLQITQSRLIRELIADKLGRGNL